MSDDSQPNQPPPKLYTKGTFVMMFCALLGGASMGMVREFRAKGTVSHATMGASAAAFVIGLIILIVISRYANKPEK